MLMRLRRLKTNEDGQAIVLAALGVLVLAVGVLATVNLGHAIHERIKLQNNADATAYSLAALEARAFNFFAFTNRAQVSHYVTVMSLQSWLAVIWFAELLLGTLTDVVSFIKVLVCGCCMSVIFSAICCPIKPIADTAFHAMDQAHKAFKTFAEWADKILGKAVYYLPMINKYGVYTTQRLMKELVQTNVLSSGRTIAYANDPKVEPNVWDIVTLALNTLEYRDAFDTAADIGSLPNANATGDAMAAQRVMTEISNATRWPDFITNRSLGNVVEGIPGIGPLFNVIPIKVEPTGQTKLTSVVEKCGWSTACRNTKRFGTQFDHSQLARGHVVAADEIMSVQFSLAGVFEFDIPLPQDYASVWASAHGDGEHCAHDRITIPTFLCGDYYFTWPECAGDHNNHKFEGIEPYVKFKPNSDPAVQFNQPSVYVALNKQPDQLGGQAFQQHFTITVGSRSEEIDTTIGKEPLLNMPQFQGLNAWSRAMAYYHRPSFPDGSSNWHEHPNFFNPFWRAKLAPIGEKVNDLASGLGLSGEFADMFTRELITH
jgi:hypothetical protein